MLAHKHITSFVNVSKQFEGIETKSNVPTKLPTIKAEGDTKNIRNSYSSYESERETSIGSNEHTYGDFGRLEDFHIDLSYAGKVVQKKKVDENKYKTEICKNWTMYGYCKYENNCKFAHGGFELNEKSVPFKEKYKTKGCQTFNTQGHCPYGSRCLFLHSEPHNPEEPKFRGPFRRAFDSFSEGKRLITPKYRLDAFTKASFFLSLGNFTTNKLIEDFSQSTLRFSKEIDELTYSMLEVDRSSILVNLDFIE